MANTGKIAEVLFENALDTYEDQTMMIDKTQVFEPEGGTMQNAGNVIWRPYDQHAPVIDGWDLTGQEQDIIETTYPAYLGTPKNDFVQQRADDLRDTTFWKRRGIASGRQQANDLNKSLANLVKNTGSLFYRSSATSGFDFIGEAQTIMNERQGTHTERCFAMNDRDSQFYAQDLAGRQTVQGRPEEVWKKGMIANNVAEFDVYTGSFLPNLAGGASPDTTVSANLSFKPEGGSVDNATGIVTNVDHREAVIPVVASASYNIGDKVTIGAVESIGVADKTETGQLMTFTVVAKPSGTSIKVYPKPIAADDVALTATEKAYANVNTTISSGDTVARLNTDTSARTNLFWDKDSIEVVGGTIPAELMKQYDGMKVIRETLSNGLNMYMVYDANMVNMNLRYRLFLWYGLTNKDPSRNGVAARFTA
jgi:hypothetical protein